MAFFVLHNCTWYRYRSLICSIQTSATSPVHMSGRLRTPYWYCRAKQTLTAAYTTTVAVRRLAYRTVGFVRVSQFDGIHFSLHPPAALLYWHQVEKNSRLDHSIFPSSLLNKYKLLSWKQARPSWQKKKCHLWVKTLSFSIVVSIKSCGCCCHGRQGLRK